MNHNPYTQGILDNGLRLVHLHTPGAPVGYAGVAVNAGSADELTPADYGLAHFVEHTIFKGTARRKAWHIINRMEAVGGELNAFTTKQDTVLYTAFPRGNLHRALDLLADLVTGSVFPAAEIDREREVICDEINSYLDSTADAVYDDFEDMIYSDTPLGHNILGTLDSVANIDSGKCRGWLDSFYRPGNMVLFYAGSWSYDVFLRHARETFGHLASNSNSLPPTRTAIDLSTLPATTNRCEQVATHQAHTVMGCALPPLHGKERIAMAVLTNLLGGPGMNSLLNLSLRERRGLVYTVEASLSHWRDTAMFSTYFGTDPQDNDKCIHLVNNAIADIVNGKMTERRLQAARKQFLGQQILGSANAENRVISIARAILAGRTILTPDELRRNVESVNLDAVVGAADMLSHLSSLTYSPVI